MTNAMLRAVQILFIVLLIVALYGWYSNGMIPDERALIETTGRIKTVVYLHDNIGRIDQIKFDLGDSRDAFYYLSSFPQFKRAYEVLQPGATVRIVHVRGESDIWSLSIENATVADFAGLTQSRRTDGRVAFYWAVGLMVAVLGLEWQIRRGGPGTTNLRAL